MKTNPLVGGTWNLVPNFEAGNLDLPDLPTNSIHKRLNQAANAPQVCISRNVVRGAWHSKYVRKFIMHCVAVFLPNGAMQ